MTSVKYGKKMCSSITEIVENWKHHRSWHHSSSYNPVLIQTKEKFEDSKAVTRSRRSKDKLYNDQRTKWQETSINHFTEDIKPGAPEGKAVSAALGNRHDTLATNSMVSLRSNKDCDLVLWVIFICKFLWYVIRFEMNLMTKSNSH